MGSKTEIVEIPKWQLESIENALRLASMALNSSTLETCTDRNIYQAYHFAKNALNGESSKEVRYGQKIKD